MRVILTMTGGTILQNHLKITDSARTCVAIHAIKLVVPAHKFELKPVVVEIRDEVVHTIMTFQAG